MAREQPLNSSLSSFQDTMTDDDILAKIIEQTIQSQQKTKYEKKFYQSLKPKDTQHEFDRYWYGNRGVKLPGKKIKAKKPRFISFKPKTDSSSKDPQEPERPLLEDSLLTEAVKHTDLKLDSFKTTASKLKLLENTRTSQHRNKDSFSQNKTKSLTKNKIPSSDPKNSTSLDLIKSVCENYGLTRREVFEIHSQYKAMMVPIEHSNFEGNTINEEYFDALKRHRNPEKYGKVQQEKGDEKEVREVKAKGVEGGVKGKTDGIKLDFFSQNWPFLYGIHKEVKTRLFKALGIDTESRNSIIRWKQFVELYWIWELGKITKDELIKFWSKFFDPTMLGLVAVEAISDILEKCVRGTSLDEPNEGTLLFSKNIISLFRDHGCIETINNEDFVNNPKVSKAFEENRIDMKIFSDALGNKVVNFKLT